MMLEHLAGGLHPPGKRDEPLSQANEHMGRTEDWGQEWVISEFGT